LSMSVVRMRGIIRVNGHLVMEGNETKQELTEALLNLRKHTYAECQRTGLGTPIDALLPDISELVERAMTPRRTTSNIDMNDKRLV
jgi:hypothetical protein